MLKAQIFLILSVAFSSEAQISSPTGILGYLRSGVKEIENIFQVNGNGVSTEPQAQIFVPINRPSVLNPVQRVPARSGPSQACQGIYSLQQDYHGYYGLITIANPDYSRNVLNVELSLAARLSNVSRQSVKSKAFCLNIFTTVQTRVLRTRIVNADSLSDQLIDC
jgi:hypothetical protein